MSILKMAWRNLWRNRRRTIATTSALTLALLVSALYSSMVEGYLANMVGDSLDREVGAAQVFARGYLEKPSLYLSMEDSSQLVDRLNRAGLPAAERLLGAGLAAAGDSSAGVQLRGVDVDREEAVLSLRRQLFQGRWLDPEDPRGVVLGRKLADALGVNIGGELVVLAQAADGSAANELYRARGILRNVGDATDRAGLFLTIPAFRELMAFPQGAHQIIIKRQEGIPLPLLKERAQKAAGDRDVRTWRELIPVIATLADSTRGMVSFMLFILYLMVGIVVSNAMLMAVFERIRELGLFKALGAGPGFVLLLIYLESVLQAAMAVVFSSLLSVLPLWYLAKEGIDLESLAGLSAMGMAIPSKWKAAVTLQSYSWPIVMMIIVISAAAAYPSIKAAFIKPAEAMRHL